MRQPDDPGPDRDRAPDHCQVCGAAPSWDRRSHNGVAVWLCRGCFAEAVELARTFRRRRAE